MATRPTAGRRDSYDFYFARSSFTSFGTDKSVLIDHDRDWNEVEVEMIKKMDQAR
jgi:hypothetical protein